MSKSANNHCPDCGGEGKIVLLTSIRPCQTCFGTGLAESPRPCDPLATTEYTYDQIGRLNREGDDQ